MISVGLRFLTRAHPSPPSHSDGIVASSVSAAVSAHAIDRARDVAELDVRRQRVAVVDQGLSVVPVPAINCIYQES